jgi:hypothetical protein
MNNRPSTSKSAKNQWPSSRPSEPSEGTSGARGLPDVVVAFIHEQLFSVEELEVLLLLKLQPHRQWTVREVSDELRSTTWSVALRLFDLHSRGFLQVEPSTEPTYRYGPSSISVAEVIDKLAPAYAQKPHTVISLIFAKVPESREAMSRRRGIVGR